MKSKATWLTWVWVRELMKTMQVGQSLWVDDSDPQQLQRFITNRSRRPVELRDRDFKTSIHTAVEHMRVGVVVTIVRITRTA